VDVFFYCTFFFYLIWALPEINVIVLYCIIFLNRFALLNFIAPFSMLFQTATTLSVKKMFRDIQPGAVDEEMF